MSVTNRLLVVLLALVTACAPVGGKRYSRKQAQKSLQKLEKPGIVVGEFHLSKIVDGDTIKVEGLDASLRLIGDDTEETFKNEADRRGAEAGFEAYLKEKKGSSSRPVKAATPMGEQAKVYAKNWFAGVDKVRIERDHPAEIRDRYNRYLAYVFANKNGTWVNYNVEVVRAGMSPYFPKYGNSRRFHAEFIAAQD
jgi:endonuclease YncB( thermonuclease family)